MEGTLDDPAHPPLQMAVPNGSFRLTLPSCANTMSVYVEALFYISSVPSLDLLGLSPQYTPAQHRCAKH